MTTSPENEGADCAKKSCPYCGEQILAVAIKCKYCSSNLITSGNERPSATQVRPGFVAMLLGILVISMLSIGTVDWDEYSCGLVGGCLDKSDISKYERSIREKYEANGIRVVDVKLSKESAHKLNGFVTIESPLLGQIRKGCVVSAETFEVRWECG